MATEMNLLFTAKGDHRYVYVYDDESVDALVDHLGRQAASPELDIDFGDVTPLVEIVRRAATRRAARSCETVPRPRPCVAGSTDFAL